MGDRDDAIEAGAAASYERHRAERPDLGLKPWTEAGPNMRRSCIAEAATHYDAMAPLIRQAAAMEFAEVVENTAFSISQVFNRSPKDYLDEAAMRIRKIGGTS